MDNNNEDTLVRQIEKNLTNSMNENLFLTGRIYENNKAPANGSYHFERAEDKNDLKNAQNKNYPLVSYDNISDQPTAISRAEYIRQAREACLRQLSNTQIYSRPYDVNYMASEDKSSEQLEGRKERAWKLFREDSRDTGTKEEVSPQEAAAFRSLIIRMVCAIVLFLSVFMIDKFNIIIGKLSPDIIQAYVTGNDTLQRLEEVIVTWLK